LGNHLMQTSCKQEHAARSLPPKGKSSKNPAKGPDYGETQKLLRGKHHGLKRGKNQKIISERAEGPRLTPQGKEDPKDQVKKPKGKNRYRVRQEEDASRKDRITTNFVESKVVHPSKD